MDEKRTFTGLYFGVLPDFRDLVGYLVEEHSAGLSTIQPLGCRELLFTEPRIILSPCLESGSQAFLVCKKYVMDCGKFQALMDKLKFKVIRQVELNKELFLYCLAFTMIQKLAPLWNKTGEYFVQGRNFLEGSSKLTAVSMEVNITDRLCIALKPFNIKLHLSSPGHFCSSSNILQSFLTQKHFTVSQDSIPEDLCYVLPSLKKGRVIGISHDIPTDCPFQYYEDLRRHWKLMYGYRLPPTEAVFYNVRFSSFSKGKVFTYPSSCIHSNLPQTFLRCDQQAIFQTFLQDIQNRIPCICESPLKLTSTPHYSCHKLHSASNDRQSSLTRVPPELKHCTPYSLSHVEHKQASKPVYDISENTVEGIANDIVDGSRLVPNFTKRIPESNHRKVHSESSTEDLASSTPKVQSTSVFKAKRTVSKDTTSSLQGPLESQTHHDNALSQQPEQLTPSISYASHAKKLPEMRPGLTLSRSATKSTHHSSLCSTENLNKPLRLLTNTITDCPTTTHSGTFNALPDVSMKDQVRRSDYGGTQPISNTDIKQHGSLSSLCNGTPNKRQQSTIVEINAMQIKKPRLKPKIQEDVDVQQLAIDNQLRKVNTTTLSDWLKKRNIAVKQKDKKVDLIEKVLNVIRSNAALES